MRDSTIALLWLSACATLLAALYDGEILLLVAGALVGGIGTGAYRRMTSDPK